MHSVYQTYKNISSIVLVGVCVCVCVCVHESLNVHCVSLNNGHQRFIRMLRHLMLMFDSYISFCAHSSTWWRWRRCNMQCIVCPISAVAYWNRRLFMERKLKRKANLCNVKLWKLTSQHIGMENDEELIQSRSNTTCYRYCLAPNKKKQTIISVSIHFELLFYSVLPICIWRKFFVVRTSDVFHSHWKSGWHDVHSFRFHFVWVLLPVLFIYDWISNKQFSSHANGFEIWFWCVCVCVCAFS